MGLAALALESNPVFPTFPNRIPHADVSAGLVLPYAAVALLGKGGASATLLLIFMAVTSASSAELIAVSSIWTYDIYQTYINPSASGKFLIRMSHVSCVVYAIVLASFSTGLFYAGVGMVRHHLATVFTLGSANALYLGLPLSPHGLYHLQRRPASYSYVDVEGPELASRSRRSCTRFHLRHYCLACDGQEGMWCSQRRLHGIQQSDARWQRHCIAQPSHLHPCSHLCIW